MKSVRTLVTTGLATLAIFSCAVPSKPPPVVETPAPPSFAPRESASEGKPPVVVETPALFKSVPPPAPEVAPEDKTIFGRKKAMEVIREEEFRHPGYSFELLESHMMSRAGPRFTVIAKKKASSDVVKKD